MLYVAIKNLDELPGILTSIVGAFEAPHILTNMRKTLKLFSITSSCMESNSVLRKSWINENVQILAGNHDNDNELTS